MGGRTRTLVYTYCYIIYTCDIGVCTQGAVGFRFVIVVLCAGWLAGLPAWACLVAMQFCTREDNLVCDVNIYISVVLSEAVCMFSPSDSHWMVFS